jgi:uncharacterized protein (TIGR00369 family)
MTNPAAVRSRTTEWYDPMELAALARGRRGLELMQDMIAGKIPSPPIAVTVGFRLIEVKEGEAVFVLTPGEHQYNPIGVVHGGVASTLLDSAMGCAVHTTLAAGEGYTTLELKVNLVRAITLKSGPLRAEGKVVHLGRSTATAEARLVDAENRLYAHGSSTCLVMRAPG